VSPQKLNADKNFDLPLLSNLNISNMSSNLNIGGSKYGINRVKIHF